MSYKDKLGRDIKEGDFIVYPHKAGSSGSELKLGFVVGLRETKDPYSDKSRPWLSCITAECYWNEWRVQNKGRAVPISVIGETCIVGASVVPSGVRQLLKDASVK